MSKRELRKTPQGPTAGALNGHHDRVSKLLNDGESRWPQSTLCFPWGRASSTSPLASIRPGTPRLGSPGRTAMPGETLKCDVNFNILPIVIAGLYKMAKATM